VLCCGDGQIIEGGHRTRHPDNRGGAHQRTEGPTDVFTPGRTFQAILAAFVRAFPHQMCLHRLVPHDCKFDTGVQYAASLNVSGCLQAECGYDVSWQVLNARGWVPQSRERVYIVGFRRDLHIPPMDWALLKAKSEDACSETVAGVLEPPESPAVVRSPAPI
jgi:hypothetical protein